MPWDVRNVVERRVEFVQRAAQEGGNFSELCREFGITRPTGYLWVRRYEGSGTVRALSNRSRRPHRSPSRTPERIEQRVVERFHEEGGEWGPKKIRHLLLKEEGIELELTTVKRIFRRHGLNQTKNIIGPALQRFERQSPNALWQMDYKGQFKADDEHWCYPLSILDDHSRFCVALHALEDQKLQRAQRSVIKTFEEFGVPDAMLMDHGVPWWSASNGWGLTRLSVELINQGIRLHFSRIRHPQTQGKVERFHKTLKHSLRCRYQGKISSVRKCVDILGEIRQRYNFVRPHEALGMEVPASRYRPSPKTYNPAPRSWEYPVGAATTQLDTLGRVSWEGKRFFVCEALPKQYVQTVELEDSVLVVYRNMAIRELDIDAGTSIPIAFPITDNHPLLG